MLRIRAFQGLVPAPSLVERVACVPYDVIDSAEAAALAEGNPHSLLHVDRAEIDCPPGTDIHSDAVYAKAVENFQRLQKEGVLVRESGPCVYVYQQTMGDHVQNGVAAVCHIEDYENNLIKKHEKTRKDKEDDRTRLVGDLRANTGPIFLTYRDHDRINELVAAARRETPVADFVAPDGIVHRVWRVEGGEDLVAAFAEVPCSYVADGHHRTASAARVGRELRAANPHHTGEEDYNWFLAVLFPASELRILPYNRIVHDLNGHTKEEFLRLVGEKFQVTSPGEESPTGPGWISLYLDGEWFNLRAPERPQADPVSQLDVSILQEELLAPILGIDDPRTSQRIEFIGGIRGPGELVRKVESGRAAVAFSMFPTTVEQLMAIADAGQIMPPKSTWFEPKLRSGLFIHTF
jgi:uncharacterized protein (DUF1015 family)